MHNYTCVRKKNTLRIANKFISEELFEEYIKYKK